MRKYFGLTPNHPSNEPENALLDYYKELYYGSLNEIVELQRKLIDVTIERNYLKELLELVKLSLDKIEVELDRLKKEKENESRNTES